ncbi:MAG TPA: YcnI family protein, partial [Microbacterium sp.]|uniref:YcnI family copper-binding membrane protein n=1 Tax=Microbacterium sp. TaxID=51671 RepID=UPI002CD3C7E6
ADAGSYTLVDFKVPNESATASTVKVVLTLPADTPFLSVRYVPVPGWTAEVVETSLSEPVTVGDVEVTEAVTSVVWTATGDGIGEDALEVFPLSLGPVPDTGAVVLAVDQTYSDGRTVSWADPAEDAEHPAPVLYIGDQPADDHHAPADAYAAAAAPSQEPDVLARVLAGAGLLLGAAALVLVLVGRRTRA